jgi:predicted dehydrogenase
MSGVVFHVPFLLCNPHYRIVSVLERTKELSKGKIPGARIVRSFDEIINDPQVDLVVVNTPNELHYSMSRDSLMNGKHVIVEKPFTNTIAEAEELIVLAREKNLVLSVYQSKRTEGDFKTVKHIINSGMVGNLKVFESNIMRWKPDLGYKKWKIEERPGAGILYDLGSHLIDQALHLFGMPHSLWADLRCIRPGAIVDDYFDLHLFYENFKVILRSGTLAKDEGYRYTLYGDKGTYVKYGCDNQEGRLLKGEMPDLPDWGEENEEFYGTLTTTEGKQKIKTLRGSYQEIFENTWQAVVYGAELVVKPEEALNVIKIIELAHRSFKEKRVTAV